MAKALTEEQARRIIPRSERAQARLEAREGEALSALAALGFRVTVHEYGRHVKADELLRIGAGYRPGQCYAVMYGADGKRKHVSGSSAVEALADARAWWAWQERLKPESPQRFVRSAGNEPTPEAAVRQRVAGDAAETALRRASTERRIVSFDGGAAHLVDAHGDPLKGDGTRATQIT